MPQTIFSSGLREGIIHYTGTADVLSYPGIAVIDSTAADLTTLAAPTPGVDVGQPAGATPGDDGKDLWIVSTTAFAHKVTVPTGKLMYGATAKYSTITFAAYAGANLLLQAMSGFWVVIGMQNVTLT